MLSVAFNSALMKTREALLRSRGYTVTSVLGAEPAKAAAGQGFDVFAVGHAAPWTERRDLVRWLKQNFPGVPVVCLLRNRFEEPIPEADCSTDVEDPKGWLAAVEKCMG